MKIKKINKMNVGALEQGFPKGGPRNPGVSWKGHKGSAICPKIVELTLIPKTSTDRD